MKLRFLLMVGLAAACVWGQKSGATGGTSGGTSPGGTSGGTTSGTGTAPGTGTAAPGNAPSTSTSNQQSTTASPPPQPIFLSGNVVIDDGTPLPINVGIQSVCGTTQRIMAHAAANGDFNFRWTFGISSTFEDASENGRVSNSLISGGSSSSSGRMGGSPPAGALPDDPLANCELRADLPGYTSTRIPLYNHASNRLDFDVGTITLHRITGDEGRVVSALSLKAPKDAKKNFDKGQQEVRAHKTAEAAASFQKAVTAYPQYADAWLELGRAQLQLGAKDDARNDFQKAMELDEKLIGAWQQLGYLASDQGHWAEASRYLDQAVKLDPMNSAVAWYFDAMANFNQGKFDVAERSIRAEMKLNTDPNPRADFLLGMVLIARKDLAGGATVLRKFVATYPDSEDVPSARKILASAENALASAHP